MYRGLVSLLAVSSLFAAGAAASTLPPAKADQAIPGAVDSWCSGKSEAGDATCTAILKERGRYILVFGTSRTNIGSYVLCVTNPKGQQRCLQRRTSENDGTVGDAVIFQRKFPHDLKGTYGVSWRTQGRRLGPVLQLTVR